MKKLATLTAFVLATLCSTAVFADDITVYDDTDASETVPVNGYDCDMYYLRTQMIYPEALITTMEGKSITGMTFYIKTNATKNWNVNFEVRLATTTNTEYTSSASWIDVSSVDPVFENKLSGTGITMTINFTTPFVYSGGNLLVDIQSTEMGEYSKAVFYGHSALFDSPTTYPSATGKASSRASIGASRNYFMPKTTFKYTEGGSSCAKPTDVMTSSVDATSASINWSASGQVQYINVVKGSPIVWDGLTPTSDASATITGLTPDTEYDFYIRSYCSVSEQSAPVKVTFKTEKSCFEPTLLTISNIDANSANLGWSASGHSETSYQYVCVEKGVMPDWTKAKTDGSFFVLLDKLNPATEYDVYVRSACGTDDYSESVKESFKTICGKITSLPFSENFDAVSALPECWSNIGGAPSVSNKQLFFNLGAGVSKTAVLPEFNDHISTLTLSLDYSTNTYDEAGNGKLEIGYMNGSTFVPVKEFSKVKEMTSVSVDFVGAPTEADHIAIRATGIAATFLYVDNVVVSLTPKCPNPVNLSCVNLTYDGGTFIWMQGDDENNYQYAVVEKDAAVADGAWTKTDKREMKVTGKTAGTTYDFVVRSYCDEFKQGDEVRVAFTPKCGTIENVAISGITSTEATITWDAVDYATTYAVKVGTIDYTATKNELHVSSLTPNTEYAVSVAIAAPCTGDFSTAVSFFTKCAPLTGLPFSENFDAVVGQLPECWDMIATDPVTGVIAGIAAYGGTGKCFDFYGAGTQSLILPELSTSMVDLTLSFFYKCGAGGVFKVGYFEPGETTFNELKELEVIYEYSASETSVDLKSASENAANIVIQYSTSTTGQGFVDNITVKKTSDIVAGIDTLQGTTRVIKRIENGQLVIIRDGVRYNAIGTVME